MLNINSLVTNHTSPDRTVQVYLLKAYSWLSSKCWAYKNSMLLVPRTWQYRSARPELQALGCAWILEWLLIIEYSFGEWTRASILHATRVPTFMLLCLLYWFWLWGMAVWRRSQFGKFTRGERKLWAKGLTSFWVAELVTALSFVLVFGFLSWGPLPLVPRVFMVSRRGIILELVIYSYILMLAYSAKMLMKWNTWRTQVNISLIVLLLLSYILWKDILLLLTRENLYLPQAARWRNIRTSVVVYSLSHEWWAQHMTTLRAPHARHNAIGWYLQNKQRPNFANLPAYSLYEQCNTLESIDKSQRGRALAPGATILWMSAEQLQPNSATGQPFLAYPRRTGFVPKRISMWHLLVVLKMWHHLILVLWWSLYIFRLTQRQKTAYAFLGSCAFNVFCCLILALVVYSLSYFQRWELLLKFKPDSFGPHRLLLAIDMGMDYVQDHLTIWNKLHATRA